MSKLSVATKIATVAAHVGFEPLSKPTAVRVGDVPRGPDALTREWLTAVCVTTCRVRT